jgi:hypothetical protein
VPARAARSDDKEHLMTASRLSAKAPSGIGRLIEAVDASWSPALAPVEADLTAMAAFLAAEAAAGHPYLPADSHILRAFAQPFAGVRVVVVGQDPYATACDRLRSWKRVVTSCRTFFTVRSE